MDNRPVFIIPQLNYKITLSYRPRLMNISLPIATQTNDNIESKYIISMCILDNMDNIICDMKFNESSLIDFGGDFYNIFINGYNYEGISYSDFNTDMSYYKIFYKATYLGRDFPMDSDEDESYYFKIISVSSKYNTNCDILDFSLLYPELEQFVLFIGDFLSSLPDNDHFTIEGLYY